MKNKKKLKYLKLLNGEDIVGLEIKNSYWKYEIYHPVQVSSYRVEETGEIAFDFIPWSYSANTDHSKISKSHILGIFEAKNNLKEQYIAYLAFEKKREGFLEQPIIAKQEAIEQYLLKKNGQEH